VGFIDFLRRPLASLPPRVVSPYSPQDTLNDLVVADLYPELPNALTKTTALRIPAVKRAHDLTCTVLARMPWRDYHGATESAEQPSWLLTSATMIPPRNLRYGVVSDLFMYGWAAIGFQLVDGRPADALYLPYGTWAFNEASKPEVTSDAIPTAYRQRVVPIQLGEGSNGILVDGYETLDDARAIEAAYRDRINNPIPQTILTITGDRWDGWSRDEREEFRQRWMKSRSAQGGATAMKPDWVSADFSGDLPTELFESGRNANRLDIANHAGIPAGLVEGVRQGGSGGGTEIRYSGAQDNAVRNELWDLGLSKYADAIEARLSLDDVCEPGHSIRVETGPYLSVPQPTGPITSED